MSSDSKESTVQNKDAGGRSRLSLYSLIGEEGGIQLFVEQFYHAMLSEPLLKPLFQESELDALKAEQKEFVAIILGGRPPLDYWDIITSDPPPYLTLEHTDLMIEYAEAILLNMNLDDAAVKNIVRVLSPFIEAFICGSTKADAKPQYAASQVESPGSLEEVTELKEEAPEEEVEEAASEGEELPVSAAQEDPSPEPVSPQRQVERIESTEETENARRFRELIEGKLQQKTQKPVLTQNEGEFVPSEIPAAVPSENEQVAPEVLATARPTAERVVGALNVLLSELEQAVLGDLTTEISFTGDDLVGRLGSSVQELLSGLRGSISRLSELVEEINRTSDDLRQLLDEREEVKRWEPDQGKEDSLASAGEEAIKAFNLSAGILHSLRTFFLGDQHCADKDTIADKQAREPLHALISHNDEFQYLIRSLREITSRGATLALNAALEAARAGNEGKCFAVIASEMKDLARGSEQLAMNLARNFKACRYYAHETLSALEKGSTLKPPALPAGMEADLNSLGETLTKIDAKISSALREKALLDSCKARLGESDGRCSGKMFELGKKVRELKLVLSKYVV